MQYTTVDVFFKGDPMPKEFKSNMQYLVFEYIKSAAISMLNDRLAELAQKPECPYLQAGANYGSYLFSKTKDAFNLDALPKEGMTEQSLQAVFTEARRAAEFGFTATEYQRYKQNFESQLDKIYSNKDKRYNAQFCKEYVDHYLDNDPIPSLDDYYQIMKQISPVLPLEAVNGLMKELVADNDSNMVVLCFNQEKEGATYPTEQSLLKAIADARQTQIEQLHWPCPTR
jgi:zinc protease